MIGARAGGHRRIHLESGSKVFARKIMAPCTQLIVGAGSFGVGYCIPRAIYHALGLLRFTRSSPRISFSCCVCVCVCVCFCVFMEPDRAVDIDITGDRRAGGLVHAAHHPPLALPETAQGGTRVLYGTCLPRINQ